MRRVPVVLFGLLLGLVASAEAGKGGKDRRKEARLCRPTQGLDFAEAPPYNRLGRLDFCFEHQHHTCCERGHTQLLERRSQLAAAHGLSDRCRRLTDEVNCGACHPGVGVGNVTELCPGLCRRWHAACADDFFAVADGGSGLVPCSLDRSVVCARAADIAADGAAFCAAMGRRVQALASEDDSFLSAFGSASASAPSECFDGSAAKTVGPPEPGQKPRFESGTMGLVLAAGLGLLALVSLLAK